MEPIRILYVNGGLMDRGGVASVMMSYFLRIDPKVVHIDFVVHGNGVGDRDEEILHRGSKIFKVPPKSKDFGGNYRGLKKIMSEGKYDIVHAHADSGNALILKIAKECGIKVRISHSHNTNFTITNQFRILLNYFQMKQISKYATHKWACSVAAGEWLYGLQSRFEVIPNAIELSKFKFDSAMRDKLRIEYGLMGKRVIGHIGRFDYQKNQLFLIDAFAKAAEKDETLRLILIGDGKDRTEIENAIKKSFIEDKVILMGQRSDVYSLLNIMDIFVLPSKFEGFPVVTIEAQANGLHCLCSDIITRETNLTGNNKYLPLEKSIWTNELLKVYKRDESMMDKIIEQGYEIINASQKLQERYIQMVK